MTDTRSHWKPILVAVLAIALLAWHEWSRQPDAHATIVRFFSIGQGDSIFITSPSGKHILVDGGPDLSALERLGEAMPFFDRSIDLLVLSHPHFDHVASFPQILRRYDIGQVLIPAPMYDNGPYEEFLTLVQEQHIPIIIPTPGSTIDMGDGLTFTVLWPADPSTSTTVAHIHETCVALRMTYGDDSLMLTGDMELDAEEAIVKRGDLVESTVLKVAHHGSLTSSGSGWLATVKPQLAVISAGVGNSYGLPKKAILDRLTYFGIPYRTTMSGTIVWRMDGQKGL